MLPCHVMIKAPSVGHRGGFFMSLRRKRGALLLAGYCARSVESALLLDTIVKQALSSQACPM
jgi:hypothetical protein